MFGEPKLPETLDELMRVQRAAFEAGAHFGYEEYIVRTHGPNDTAFRNEARCRYPITRKVPRVMKFPWNWSPATVVDFNGTEPKVRLPDGVTYLTAEDLDALRDLLANPFEEISE